MEFWGVEVKNGESLKVTPGEDMILHLTQPCLGIKQGKGNERVCLSVKFGDQKIGVKVKNGESLKVTVGEDTILHLTQACQGKENEPVCLFVKFGDQELGIGTLSPEKLPQISLNLVFEKEFEFSHSWKHGSVFFTGYRERHFEEVTDSSDYEDDDSPFNAANVEPEYKTKKVVLAIESNQTGKMRGARKDDNVEDEEDSSESDGLGEDTSKDESTENGDEAGSSEDEEDDSDEEDNEESEDEETPKKPEAGIKRPAESSKETPFPEKKAKSVTPHKTDGEKGGHVHIATPYPSKQAGKAALINAVQAKQQTTPKSTGEYTCKTCHRSFNTEARLQTHKRVKHSAK